MPNGKELMHAPRFKYEINLNTLAQAAGLTAMLGSVFYVFGQMQQDISNVRETVNARYEHVDTAYRKMESRVVAVESETRRIENLTYRLGEQEKLTSSLNMLLGDLKERMAEQSSDIRIIRDTVKRLEARDDKKDE